MDFQFTNRSSGRHSGFALIENLIAIVLVTIGALGIAASTSATIRFNSDNQARAMALAVATKTLESIFVAAEAPGNDDADFKALIRSFVATEAVPGTPAFDGKTVQGNVAAGAGEDFVVSVTAAIDAIGTNVLSATGPYVSPVTVAVLVTYQGNAGRTNSSGIVEISDVKQVRASFTYILPKPLPVAP